MAKTSCFFAADVPILRWNTTAITVAGIVNDFGNASNQLNSPTDIRLDGSTETGNNQFSIPYGIALNPTSGILSIADYNNHRIMSYASGVNSGALVFGGNGRGKNNTQLYNPTGLYFDSFSNSLIIVNYAAHNIVRYVLDENSWTLVAGDINRSPGMTSTKFYYPIEIAFDPMSNMYIADRSNHRIQFFDANQLNATTIAGVTGIAGNNATTFNQP